MAATCRGGFDLGDGSVQTSYYLLQWYQLESDEFGVQITFLNNYEDSHNSLNDCRIELAMLPWITKVQFYEPEEGGMGANFTFSITPDPAQMKELDGWLRKFWSSSRWQRWRR